MLDRIVRREGLTAFSFVRHPFERYFRLVLNTYGEIEIEITDISSNFNVKFFVQTLFNSISIYRLFETVGMVPLGYPVDLGKNRH